MLAVELGSDVHDAEAAAAGQGRGLFDNAVYRNGQHAHLLFIIITLQLFYNTLRLRFVIRHVHGP